MSWWSELSLNERRTFRACFGGWALDGMDFQLYSFVIPTLIAEWHLSKGQAGTLQTATLLVSALGGWLAGLPAGPPRRLRPLPVTLLRFRRFAGPCGRQQRQR